MNDKFETVLPMCPKEIGNWFSFVYGFHHSEVIMIPIDAAIPIQHKLQFK
jgi:hypothetical protein